MRTTPPPWGSLAKGWAAAFGSSDAELRVLADKGALPPATLAVAAVSDVVAMLEQLANVGLNEHDSKVVACMYWSVEAVDLMRICLLEHAHEQCTDGELLAMLEGGLRPLNDMDAHATIRMMHPEIVRVRFVARAELRRRAWAMLDATKTVVVRDSKDKQHTEQHPDHRTQWAACKELTRQYGGWTRKGMAEETQEELEQAEKSGPDIEQPRVLQ